MFGLVACSQGPIDAPTHACPDEQVDDGGVCVPARCGVGVWGGVDADVYVDASAGAGGDGTEAAPFASITAAVASRVSGSIAVAAGTYSEVLALNRENAGISITGRCSDMTTLDSSQTDAEEAAIGVSMGNGDEATLAGMRVTGGRGGGLLVAGGSVTGTDLAIAENSAIGVGVTGTRTTVSLHDSSVTDTIAVGRSATGHGVEIVSGTFTATNIQIERNTAVGILVSRGALTLTDSSVVDTLPESGLGRAIVAEYGATLDVTGGSIAGSTGIAVNLFDSSTTATLDGVAIADTIPANGTGGGVFACLGAKATLRDVSIVGMTGYAVYANNPSTEVVLDRTTISGTLEAESANAAVYFDDEAVGAITDSALLDGEGMAVYAAAGTDVAIVGSSVSRHHLAGIAVGGGAVSVVDSVIEETSAVRGDGGYGVYVWDGGSLEMTRTFVLDNQRIGVIGGNAGTVVRLEDTEVTDTRPEPSGDLGRGVEMDDFAAFEMTGGTLTGNSNVGLLVSSGATASLTDCTIESTVPDDQGLGGVGIHAQYGGLVFLDGVSLVGNRGAGVVVLDSGTSLVASDLLIKATYPDQDGTGGRAVSVQGGGYASISESQFVDNREIGLIAMGEDTIVELDEVSIDGTNADAHDAVAVGLDVQEGAVLTGTRVRVSGTQGTGLYLTAGGSVACAECELSDNAVVGAVVFGGALRATDLVVTGNGTSNAGVGVYATDRYGEGVVDLVRAEVYDHAYAGLWFEGQGDYLVASSDLRGGAGVEVNSGGLVHGNAIYAQGGVGAWDGSHGLYIEETTLSGAGVAAVLLHGASASFAANVWSDNAVDVVQQDCTDVGPPVGIDAVPGVALCDEPWLLTGTFGFNLSLSEESPSL